VAGHLCHRLEDPLILDSSALEVRLDHLPRASGRVCPAGPSRAVQPSATKIGIQIAQPSGFRRILMLDQRRYALGTVTHSRPRSAPILDCLRHDAADVHIGSQS